MPPVEGKALERMPQIVIIVDELADLMMVAPGEVEEAICRLAQPGESGGNTSGTGNTKAIGQCHYRTYQGEYAVKDRIFRILRRDSRTIIDMNGAEKLLGKRRHAVLSVRISEAGQSTGPLLRTRKCKAW